KYNLSTFDRLSKASYIELFFDLVFVFCLHGVIEIALGGGDGTAGVQDYLTFSITFAIMLQSWFCTTLLMNRFGTADVQDIACLIVCMFALLNMMHAIDMGTTGYMLFNISWALLNANLALHWALRLKMIEDAPAETIQFIKRVALVLAVQALVIVVLAFLQIVTNQLISFVAFFVGMFAWSWNSKDLLDEAQCEHLVERCSLLLILVFGEMIMGVAGSTESGYTLLDSAMFLLLALGLFLVYLNQIEVVLDKSKLGNGFTYMAFMAWIMFCGGNVAAGLEMMNESISFTTLSGELFCAASVTVFLLSFFMFMPFAKDKELITRKWIVKRFFACLGPVLYGLIAEISLYIMFFDTRTLPANTEELGLYLIFYAVAILALLAVYFVLFLDRKLYISPEKKQECS
ncbi:MAG: low temperature requirement protein A, partial [Anaerotardibacter sp.]